NGITLSPDEKVMYVGSNLGQYVMAYDVQADGTLRNPRSFAYLGMYDGSVLDGITVDQAGRVYVTDGNNVYVLTAKGERLGVIPFPSRAGNLAFSGPGKKTLYVVGRGAIYRVAMLAAGVQSRAK